MEREAPVARVAICDPSEISTVGIAHSLSRQGMDVAGIALEPVAAFSLIGSGLANVVLADPSMRQFGELTRSAVLAGMPVIAIGVAADPANAFAALRAGACGYITKDLPARSWVEAIKAALRGEAPLSRAMTACLVDEFRSLGPPSAILEYLPSNRRLTRREWEVLSCIAEGYTNRRVAAQLSISMETVRTHVSNILAKLETPNRSGAAAKYHQLRSAQ
jgi:DNA-binding NarL/FixJ family response regulator